MWIIRMSQNMKTLLSNTKFYNFSKKFWQVTAYLELFFWGGQKFHGGLRPPLEPPLLLSVGYMRTVSSSRCYKHSAATITGTIYRMTLETVALLAFLSVNLTRGQSNLTKSASRGPIPRLGVTQGGRKLYH